MDTNKEYASARLAYVVLKSPVHSNTSLRTLSTQLASSSLICNFKVYTYTPYSSATLPLYVEIQTVPTSLLFFFFTTIPRPPYSFFFFLNNPAPPEIYPLPLHAPLPI